MKTGAKLRKIGYKYPGRQYECKKSTAVEGRKWRLVVQADKGRTRYWWDEEEFLTSRNSLTRNDLRGPDRVKEVSVNTRQKSN